MNPGDSGAPGGAPAETGAPGGAPAETGAPGGAPEDSGAPGGAPAETGAPGGAPEIRPTRETLAIVGLGLMGGSLGLAARAAGHVRSVVGYDPDAGVRRRALERGAVSEVAATPGAAVEQASVVVIAAPVSAIPGAYAALAGHLAPGTIVTDLGSAKAQIVASVGPCVPSGTAFIGGHPLAGSEKEGIDSADADLYRGAYWFLTPTPDTDPVAYGRLIRFLGGLGVHVLSMDPGRHDDLVALTSHLPQLLSSTLMGFAADISASEGGLPLITAGGFRDMTRVAASSPELWLDIIRGNREAVLGVLGRFRAALETTAGLIAAEDWPGLRETLAGAREGRASMPEKPGVTTRALMAVLVAVPDRPGAIAQVATTVGEAGVNIEDLTIVHSPSGGRGTIHLAVNGEAAARAAQTALGKRGFDASVVPGTVWGG
ncbi:MAG TPA: prephenate dehydrogenase/arogenate dehydrogenase family protein [Actinomycetota bacterium]|nr:prephenate dehydrogenase/arogenate dehydrogenase family protein [Actinomycetota bacterium]